jgi:hypothetical protein
VFIVKLTRNQNSIQNPALSTEIDQNEVLQSLVPQTLAQRDQ